MNQSPAGLSPIFKVPRAELRRQVGVRWPAEPCLVSLRRYHMLKADANKQPGT